MKKINEIMDIEGYYQLFLSMLSFSDEINKSIKNSFIDYNSKKLKLEEINSINLDDEISQKIIAKFENGSKPKPLLEFKDKLKIDNNIQICPYCGINRLDESFPIEHYLPKIKFPEFTLFGLNLFFCCNKCNSQKLNDWNNEQRIFLNPYIDDVYNKEFLRIKVFSKTEELDKYTVELIDDNVTNEEYIILNEHFKKFKLISRLNKHIDDLLSELVEVTIDYILDDSLLKNELISQYNRNKKLFGINSIKTIFYKHFSSDLNGLKKLHEIKNNI